MEFWNVNFLSMGIGLLIGIAIIHIQGYQSEKYLRKLELKYGSIDRKRVIKFDLLFGYIHAGMYILLGLLLRNFETALYYLVAAPVIILIGYYTLRKRYILVSESN